MNQKEIVSYVNHKGSVYLTELQRICTSTEDVSKHQEFYINLYSLVNKDKVGLLNHPNGDIIFNMERNLQ